jgi:hypothetical protein
MEDNTVKVSVPVDADNKNHYVNNVKFYEEIKKYKEQYDAAKQAGTELPLISNYLGECVWKIAKGLAMKHNFRNYSYLEEMIGAGVETCIRNMHSFNPEKSQNPFSYFTQACFYAYIHIIQKEKKQTSIKKRLVLSSAIDTYELQKHDEDGEFAIPLIEYLNNLGTEEEPKKKSKVSTEIGALDQFFGDNR